MAYPAGKKAALERRLKELRKETDLVRDDIRTLSRAVKRPEDMEGLPKLKSVELESRPVPPPSRRDPVQRSVPAPEPPPAEESPRGELFGWTPPAGRAGGDSGYPSAAPSAAPKVRAASKDERLGHYLSSGGFIGGHAPMKHERNVQRNRGIAMLIVVGILAFIVFHLVSK